MRKRERRKKRSENVLFAPFKLHLNISCFALFTLLHSWILYEMHHWPNNNITNITKCMLLIMKVFFYFSVLFIQRDKVFYLLYHIWKILLVSQKCPVIFFIKWFKILPFLSFFLSFYFFSSYFIWMNLETCETSQMNHHHFIYIIWILI